MLPSDDDLGLTGSPGLDLANTRLLVRGEIVDLLDAPDDFLAWLDRVGGPEFTSLVPADPPGRRTVTLEARALREAVAGLFRSTSDGSTPAPAVWHVLDRALRAGHGSWALTLSEGRPRARPVFEARGPLAVLALLARSALETAARADPTRLRECDAPDCRRWFVDTSKGGRRRWCSMTRCGNRVKAARYRRRRAEEA